jgi:hypothetical protein
VQALSWSWLPRDRGTSSSRSWTPDSACRTG